MMIRLAMIAAPQENQDLADPKLKDRLKVTKVKCRTRPKLKCFQTGGVPEEKDMTLHRRASSRREGPTNPVSINEDLVDILKWPQLYVKMVKAEKRCPQYVSKYTIQISGLPYRRISSPQEFLRILSQSWVHACNSYNLSHFLIGKKDIRRTRGYI